MTQTGRGAEEGQVWRLRQHGGGGGASEGALWEGDAPIRETTRPPGAGKGAFLAGGISNFLSPHTETSAVSPHPFHLLTTGQELLSENPRASASFLWGRLSPFCLS